MALLLLVACGGSSGRAGEEPPAVPADDGTGDAPSPQPPSADADGLDELSGGVVSKDADCPDVTGWCLVELDPDTGAPPLSFRRWGSVEGRPRWVSVEGRYGTVWAVSDAGAVLEITGRRWRARIPRGRAQPEAVWGRSPGDLWVGGWYFAGDRVDAAPWVAHVDERSFERFPLQFESTTEWVVYVFALTSSDVWAVTADLTACMLGCVHYLYQLNGDRFEPIRGPTPDPFQVAGLARDDLTLSDLNYGMHWFDGRTWYRVPSARHEDGQVPGLWRLWAEPDVGTFAFSMEGPIAVRYPSDRR